MEKFMVRGFSTKEIVKVEIERETGSTVWIKGGRCQRKESEYQSFFDTFEEAKQHCVDEAHKKLEVVKRQLDQARSYLAHALKLEVKP